MEAKIIGLDYQGRGIAKIDNVVTFIYNALENEIVEFKIIKENKTFNEAKTIKIIKASTDRVSPICPYYEICGGCDLMHMNYDSQLKFKENKVKDTINKIAKFDVLVKPIIKAAETLNYRNKITFHISNSRIGYYEKKSNDFIEINQCLTCDSNINNLINEIKKIDLTKVTNITIRNSKNTFENMVILETKCDIDTSNLKSFSSVYLKINDQYVLKSGSSKISEKMNELTFNISPSAFFQVNTVQAIKLYDKVKEYAELTGSENVLDLYCGTGSIGLYLASKAKHVYGIEINENAIKDAIENNKINKISNADFLALNANQFLDKIHEKIDVLIVDPPRGGLDNKTIKSIIKLQAFKVIYVSCNVATLARDLKALTECYDLKELTPIDMFPNTCHVECISVLELRKFDRFLSDLIFDEIKINKGLEKVDNKLKKYIEEKILPEYELNDGGHNSEHIKYVLKRAFELGNEDEINYDILYTCVCFHDIACHIDRDNHEVLSAKRAYEDNFLNGFFNAIEMKIIREAIEDHRASLEYIPRNIYGKILSSADRKVEVKQYLLASISYEKKKNPEIDKNESVERSYQFAIKKFGKNGYAVNKSYVEDLKYKKYLEDIQYLINNKESFIKLADLIYDGLYN